MLIVMRKCSIIFWQKYFWFKIIIQMTGLLQKVKEVLWNNIVWYWKEKKNWPPLKLASGSHVVLMLTWQFDGDTIHGDANITWSFLQSIINQRLWQKITSVKDSGLREVVQLPKSSGLDAVLNKCSLKVQPSYSGSINSFPLFLSERTENMTFEIFWVITDAI